MKLNISRCLRSFTFLAVALLGVSASADNPSSAIENNDKYIDYIVDYLNSDYCNFIDVAVREGCDIVVSDFFNLDDETLEIINTPAAKAKLLLDMTENDDIVYIMEYLRSYCPQTNFIAACISSSGQQFNINLSDIYKTYPHDNIQPHKKLVCNDYVCTYVDVDAEIEDVTIPQSAAEEFASYLNNEIPAELSSGNVRVKVKDNNVYLILMTDERFLYNYSEDEYDEILVTGADELLENMSLKLYKSCVAEQVDFTILVMDNEDTKSASFEFGKRI